MMAHPFRTVSVLIAAHNAEAWLAECVESVQNQAIPVNWRLELLVGVDGCRATEDAAGRLDRDHLHVIASAESHGTYVMFNTLMQIATGDVICRFDADDVMMPGYIKSHIKNIGTADVGMSWSIYTDANLKPTSHVMAHEVFHPPDGKCRRGSEGQITIRRHVWDALGSFRPWRCAADTDFLHRAVAYGFKVNVVNKFLYYRRTHQGSLTMLADTKFGSPHRKQCERFILGHKGVYARTSKALWVNPVTTSTFMHV